MEKKDNVNREQKLKRNVSHRYLTTKLNTPFELMAENKDSDYSVRAVLKEKAERFIDSYYKRCTLQYYSQHKAYLRNAEEKISALSEHGFITPVTELIQELSDPVRRLAEMMEENGAPLLCIEDSELLLACYLMEARVLSELMRKHYREIPNGIEFLEKADEIFEDLCSKMKIPRRTRALLKGKASSRNALC
jgi:hypothetical protein